MCVIPLGCTSPFYSGNLCNRPADHTVFVIYALKYVHHIVIFLMACCVLCYVLCKDCCCAGKGKFPLRRTIMSIKSNQNKRLVSPKHTESETFTLQEEELESSTKCSEAVLFLRNSNRTQV